MKRVINALFLLLAFGVMSCNDDSGYNNHNGTPYVEFYITARVVDANKTPVKDIQMMPSAGLDMLFVNVGAKSGADGVVKFTGRDPELPKYVKFVDADGSENGGSFKEQIVDIENFYIQTDPASGGFNGRFMANIGDVVLQSR